MRLQSPAFNDGAVIPALFTHDGDNISPPLHWSDAPGGTASFAIIMEDPDAPSGPFTHWVIYNLPSLMQALDREVPEGGRYGSQAFQGINDFGDMGYGGPRPPHGAEHRYIFNLYALDDLVPLEQGALKDTLVKAMEGHVLAQTRLTGLYATHSKADIDKELSEDHEFEDAYDLVARRDITQPEDGRYDQSDEPRRKQP